MWFGIILFDNSLICQLCLQDNLEWTSGFQMHFGIIWIDRASENLTRVVKNSFRYYTTILNAFAQAIKK